MFNFTASMWADFPWQFWFFCHTSRHTGGNQNTILPDYMPVVMYVLNNTKKENVHFRQHFRFLWRKTCDLCLVIAKLKIVHLENITLSIHTSECTLWTELAGTSPSFGNETIWTHPASKVLQIKICKTPLQKQHFRAASHQFLISDFYKLYAIYSKTEVWPSGLTKVPCILLSPWYLHHFRICHKDSASLPNFVFSFSFCIGSSLKPKPKTVGFGWSPACSQLLYCFLCK